MNRELPTLFVTPLLLVAVVSVSYGRLLSAATRTTTESRSFPHDDKSADITDEEDDDFESDADVTSPSPLSKPSQIGILKREDEFDSDIDEEEAERRLGGMCHTDTKVRCAVWSTGSRSKETLTCAQLRSMLVAQSNLVPPSYIYQTILPLLSVISVTALPLLYQLLSGFRVHEKSEVWGLPPVFSVASHWRTTCGDVHLSCAVVATLLCSAPLAATAVLAMVIMVHLAEAERILQRRLRYAKLFTALTSSGRARKYGLPHFSLRKIPNIKVWLSLRAGRGFLKSFRRQRIADSVVGLTFYGFISLMVIVLTSYFSTNIQFPSTLLHWQLVLWWLIISVYLLRFMMMGLRVNQKYRNTSVLLTEQMNVQLRILSLQPSEKEKRERMVISNKVLELALKLLKEFDTPHRISGISMDPVLYNITRVILISALSTITSEIMGFDVKMWKLKGISF